MMDGLATGGESKEEDSWHTVTVDRPLESVWALLTQLDLKELLFPHVSDCIFGKVEGNVCPLRVTPTQRGIRGGLC